MRTYLTKQRLKACVGTAAASLFFVSVSACSTGSADGNDPTAATEGASPTIGFLLPEITVLRYEEKDKPYFTDALADLCPECELLYANAESDAAKQLQQAQSMLTQGVDVLVVNPYDGVAAATIVNEARLQDVPVIAYDRMIESPDIAFRVGNDYVKVGEFQATALLDRLGELSISPDEGGILMLNGAETSSNALLMKQGAHSVLDASDYEVLAEFATYDPVEANNWMSSQLTRFSGEIAGIYSVNDANAGASIAALRAKGINEIPPITGLDASLAGLQAILAGDQYMTVYNPFQDEARAAAQAAVDIANDREPAANTTIDGIPTYLTEPIAVTADNMKETVIADDFYTVDEICTPKYEKACANAGIE